ncbi:MAG TPA: hypothetical protein VFU11_04840 [Solirubrobacterales bacterium]|nr:hypothetical protein [Solirubrobacterales bacterium]
MPDRVDTPVDAVKLLRFSAVRSKRFRHPLLPELVERDNSTLKRR